jgi:hypothetical protein
VQSEKAHRANKKLNLQGNVAYIFFSSWLQVRPDGFPSCAINAYSREMGARDPVFQILIRIRIESGFIRSVDPDRDPVSESGSRFGIRVGIRTQDDKNDPQK